MTRYIITCRLLVAGLVWLIMLGVVAGLSIATALIAFGLTEQGLFAALLLAMIGACVPLIALGRVVDQEAHR